MPVLKEHDLKGQWWIYSKYLRSLWTSKLSFAKETYDNPSPQGHIMKSLFTSCFDHGKAFGSTRLIRFFLQGILGESGLFLSIPDLTLGHWVSQGLQAMWTGSWTMERETKRKFREQQDDGWSESCTTFQFLLAVSFGDLELPPLDSTKYPCVYLVHSTPSACLSYIYIFFNFIDLFMAVLGLCFCARAFSSCGEQGPLFIAVRGPLTIAASLVAEHRLQTRRLSSCGARA